jgi:hypothetical protein
MACTGVVGQQRGDGVGDGAQVLRIDQQAAASVLDDAAPQRNR